MRQNRHLALIRGSGTRICCACVLKNVPLRPTRSELSSLTLSWVDGGDLCDSCGGHFASHRAKQAAKTLRARVEQAG
jgi:hypothetical protein